MIKEIIVSVREKKTAEGKSFNTYTTFDKNNHRYKVKFRKEIKELPTETSIVVFDSTNANFSEDAYGSVLWITKIEEIKPLEKVDKVADIF